MSVLDSASGNAVMQGFVGGFVCLFVLLGFGGVFWFVLFFGVGVELKLIPFLQWLNLASQSSTLVRGRQRRKHRGV